VAFIPLFSMLTDKRYDFRSDTTVHFL